MRVFFHYAYYQVDKHVSLGKVKKNGKRNLLVM